MERPAAIGFFCEDIREEKSGQDTIIGVLSDNIAAPSLPVIMPKLHLYVRIYLPVEIDPNIPITVELTDVDGESLARSDIPKEMIMEMRDRVKESGHPYLGLIQKFAFIGLKIEKAGRLTATARIHDQHMICGALNIRQGKSKST